MKPKSKIEKYGLLWEPLRDPLDIEFYMIRKGGQWPGANGNTIGEGLFHHYKRAASLIWPHIVWHKWNELILEKYVGNNRTIAILGPASTGKTFTAAMCVLLDYFIFPDQTTVLVCSTTKELLEQRIWGEIKSLFKSAKRKYEWLPGHLIEGRLRIVTDSKDEVSEGRDFKNGLLGIPCKKGNDFVGLSDFAGNKAKRMRLAGDELSLLPGAFIHAISNLDKNPDLKVLGLGNPKETTDALGVLAEPSAEIGGWDGGIDQTPGTKTWPTRRPNGIAIQLPGDDSPNLDGKLGCDLITQEAINRDIAFYGTDSVWVSMMDLGRMPRGQGSRRVLTRQLATKHGAMSEPNWLDSNRKKIGSLDAAYSGVGGDRCLLTFGEFGSEAEAIDTGRIITAIISQDTSSPRHRQLFAFTETILVPIDTSSPEPPEDQIALFVMQQCQSRNVPPENFFYDSGMRTGLVQSFARLWSTQTNSIDCGGKPSERKVSANIDVICRDYFSKFITEIWFNVRHCCEAGQLRGLTEEMLLEFCQREWMVVSGNKIEVEPKRNMKTKTGRSPDLADSGALCLLGAILRGFIIQRLTSPKQQQTDHRWKRELKDRAHALWQNSQLNTAA